MRFSFVLFVFCVLLVFIGYKFNYIHIGSVDWEDINEYTPKSNFPIELIEQHTFQPLKDSLIVINFFELYCGPCIKEIPLLNNWKESLKNENIRFMAFTSKDSISINNFFNKNDITFNYEIHYNIVGLRTLLRKLSPDSIVTKDVIPINLVLNSRNEMIYYKEGSLTKGEINLITEKHLTKAIK